MENKQEEQVQSSVTLIPTLTNQIPPQTIQSNLGTNNNAQSTQGMIISPTIISPNGASVSKNNETRGNEQIVAPQNGQVPEVNTSSAPPTVVIPGIPQNSTPSDIPNVVSFETEVVTIPKKPIISKRRVIMLSIIAILPIIIVAVLYFWLLPTHFNKQYENNIATIYNSQSAQMLKVYESLGQPTFTSNDTTQATDATDIALSNSVIKDATADTSTLNSKNKLVLLPGTEWLSGVSQANKEHKAMKEYITDSQTFLTDYQTVTTYISQLNSIETSQLTDFLNSMNTISTAKSAAELLQDTQDSSASLSAAITSMNALKPPTDFQQLNSGLINDLGAMNTDLLDIINGLNDENSQELLNAAAQLETDGNNLSKLANTNVAGMFQNNSLIHSQVVKLETENPLGSSSTVTHTTITPAKNTNST